MTINNQSQFSLAGRKIGLLAAWGEFPIVIAKTLRSQGAHVIGLGVRDHVDPYFGDLCAEYKIIGAGQLGKAIRFFKNNSVKDATMAGKFHKTRLFEKFYWLKHLPDFECIKAFYPHFITLTRDRKDDTMLSTIVHAFAQHGIRFAPATDYAPELLVKYGTIAGRPLSRSQQKDVEFGWDLASEMGRLDVGQTVCIKGRAVLAVEAVEGTDQCIERAGILCPSGGFTVVKIAKPQQDMRFDVPTIGMETIERMHAAGAKVLVVQAEKTIFINQEDVQRAANHYGITIVATSAEELASSIPNAA